MLKSADVDLVKLPFQTKPRSENTPNTQETREVLTMFRGCEAIMSPAFDLILGRSDIVGFECDLLSLKVFCE